MSSPIKQPELTDIEILGSAPHSAKFAQVAIPGLHEPLTYACCSQTQTIKPGMEVKVELGRRITIGWVVSTSDEQNIEPKQASKQQQTSLFEIPPQRFKPILESQPAFTSEQIETFQLISQYYGTSLAEVLQNALPQRVEARRETILELVDKQKAKNCLEEKKLKGLNQKKLLEHLLESNQPLAISEARELAGSATINRLVELELLKKVEVLAANNSANTAQAKVMLAAPKLNDQQQLAVEQICSKIDSQNFSPALLFGVTGSGKTEVYIRAIQYARSLGGSVILVVPEISLTPQLSQHLIGRISEPIAILHSQLAQRLRWEQWSQILNREIKIVVGARSAIFAPVTDLKLIIVDEEHDPSYKQSEGFRYHGRDVAMLLAQQNNCCILMGSATPSLETLYNVKRGKVGLIELTERANKQPLPSIEVIDLSRIPKKERISPNFSPTLFREIKATLAAGDQVAIFFNRRGFASYLQCNSCGLAIRCAACSVSMTYHRTQHRLVCHYCGDTQAPPSRCSNCTDPNTTQFEDTSDPEFALLEERGSGTEQVVEELGKLFPQSRILRMDRDSVNAENSYVKILDAMRNRQADILVGTQMIAKGHDLPGIALVGIVDADSGLHLPDFRSSERVLHLITQASGRAGRGDRPGKVVIQTRQPNHPAIVAAASGKFLAFARYQLEQRKDLNYPPFTKLLRVIVSHPDKRQAEFDSNQLKEVLLAICTKLSEQNRPVLGIIGPAVAAYEKLRGRYRYHLLLRSNSGSALSQVVLSAKRWKPDNRETRIAYDIDAYDML